MSRTVVIIFRIGDTHDLFGKNDGDCENFVVLWLTAPLSI